MATATKNVINANIILYGTRGAGKTSNLQFIHRKVKQSQRGQIVQMQQEGYPHVSYEFLPMELGELNGYNTNLYIYTAPAHVDGSETRHNLLNEAAGVVFIVDSAESRLDDNIECLTTLKDELRFWEIDYDSFPIVFQYNKRDAIDALPVEELETQLNPEGKPFYEARANDSEGVRDTFARICKMAVKKVRGKLVTDELEGSVESKPPAPIGVSVPAAKAPAQAEKAETGGKKSGKGKQSEKEAAPATATIAGSSLSTTGGGKGRGASPVTPSEHTINEAPPPRYDDDEEAISNTTSDDLMVYDSDRPGDMEEEMATPAEKTTARVPTEAAAPIAAPVEEVAATPSGDDFLKTAISYGDSNEEPMMVGMLETEEADDVEAFAGEDDDTVDASTSGLRSSMSDGLSSVSLPEAPALAAISLAQLSSDELNIQTYVEEEDDDSGPVINLGMRAMVAEEMELEDEMLLDEEPAADELSEDAAEDDAEPLGNESVESAAADTSVEDLSGGEAAAQAAEADDAVDEGQALDDAAVAPMEEAAAPVAAAHDDDDDEEDERSIIATPEDLAAEGIVPTGSSVIPPGSLRAVPNLTVPFDELSSSSTQEDADDEVFHSERLTIDSPVDASAEVEATSDVTGEEVLPEGATEDIHDSALPDVAIAPLEEDSRGSEFEMVAEESVFETVVDESGSADSEVAPEVAAAAAAAVVAAVSTDASTAPTITGWGEVKRLDGGTLVLPVNIRLPGTSQDLELAVTLKVDLLLDALAGQSASNRSH